VDVAKDARNSAQHAHAGMRVRNSVKPANAEHGARSRLVAKIAPIAANAQNTAKDTQRCAVGNALQFAGGQNVRLARTVGNFALTAANAKLITAESAKRADALGLASAQNVKPRSAKTIVVPVNIVGSTNVGYVPIVQNALQSARTLHAPTARRAAHAANPNAGSATSAI